MVIIASCSKLIAPPCDIAINYKLFILVQPKLNPTINNNMFHIQYKQLQFIVFSGVVVVSRPKCSQLVNFRPTHSIPPCLNVIRSLVLMLKIIRMFPYI